MQTGWLWWGTGGVGDPNKEGETQRKRAASGTKSSTDYKPLSPFFFFPSARREGEWWSWRREHNSAGVPGPAFVSQELTDGLIQKVKSLHVPSVSVCVFQLGVKPLWRSDNCEKL